MEAAEAHASHVVVPETTPSLRALRGRVAPVTLANERVVPVAHELGRLLPEGGLRRGSVITVEGAPGSGCTTLALALAAAVTAAGEWATFVVPEGEGSSTSALAAADAGVALDRLAVVRSVPRDRWATVVAALLEGVSLVVTRLPPRVRPADARRLVARARERGSVLIPIGAWPDRAAVRLRAEGGLWRLAGGRLEGRALSVEVEDRGRVRRHQVA